MSVWKEALIAAVFAAGYELSAPHGARVASTALQHALGQIRLEQRMGLFQERTLQRWALPHSGLIQGANLYYAAMHWIVPIGALAVLYHRDARRYLRWRDTAVWATALSLACNVLFPVTPPRLLPPAFGFVDTITRVGGLGGWDAVLEKAAGNAVGAQPSVHLAWALGATLAVYPVLRTWWTRALALAHPVITVLVVVVTANHYFIDLLGGLAALGVGFGLAGLTPLLLNREEVGRAGRAAARQPSAAPSAETTAGATAAGPP